MELIVSLVATLNPATMELLSLFRGDTIIVRYVAFFHILSRKCLLTDEFCYRGKKRRDTVLICLSSDDVEEGRIQMNKVARNNLRVKLGDLVNVHQCLDIKYGKRVHILPFDDSIEGLSGNIFDVYLKPYFLEGMLTLSFFQQRNLTCSLKPTDPFARATLSLFVEECEQ